MHRYPLYQARRTPNTLGTWMNRGDTCTPAAGWALRSYYDVTRVGGADVYDIVQL